MLTRTQFYRNLNVRQSLWGLFHVLYNSVLSFLFFHSNFLRSSSGNLQCSGKPQALKLKGLFYYSISQRFLTRLDTMFCGQLKPPIPRKCLDRKGTKMFLRTDIGLEMIGDFACLPLVAGLFYFSMISVCS